MGVKDLWSILELVKEEITLDQLSGTSVAIDLGFWICQMQSAVSEDPSRKRVHLRNLYFRIVALLERQITIIAIADGEPPELKKLTMSRRQNARMYRTVSDTTLNKENNYRYPGLLKSSTSCKALNNINSVTSKNNKRKGHRSKFRSELKECCELLHSMGVAIFEAPGEAEAYCAILNAENVVNGVITDDNDAFLYGARTVYRNFSIDSKNAVVDCYQMNRIEDILHLNREKLIALGLLIGCDYCSTGIPGIGKETALKYLRNVPNEYPLLNRLSSMVNYSLDGTDKTVTLKIVPHCHRCKHPGSKGNHETDGCSFCQSRYFCDPNDSDYICTCSHCSKMSTKQLNQFECMFRTKVKKMTSFPVTEIVAEYFQSNRGLCKHNTANIKWVCPNFREFQEFTERKLEWTNSYSTAKIFPLIVRWNLYEIMHKGDDFTPNITPYSVLKSRVKNGVPSFEVQWKKLECDNKSTETEFYITLEKASLFEKTYPRLVAAFHEQKVTKKATKKRNVKLSTQNSLIDKTVPLASSLQTDQRTLDAQIADTLEKSLILYSDSENDNENSNTNTKIYIPEPPPYVSTPVFNDYPRQDDTEDLLERFNTCVDELFDDFDKSLVISDGTVIDKSLTITTEPLHEVQNNRSMPENHSISTLLTIDETNSPLPLLERLKSKFKLKT